MNYLKNKIAIGLLIVIPVFLLGVIVFRDSSVFDETQALLTNIDYKIVNQSEAQMCDYGGAHGCHNFEIFTVTVEQDNRTAYIQLSKNIIDNSWTYNDELYTNLLKQPELIFSDSATVKKGNVIIQPKDVNEEVLIALKLLGSEQYGYLSNGEQTAHVGVLTYRTEESHESNLQLIRANSFTSNKQDLDEIFEYIQSNPSKLVLAVAVSK